MSRWKAALIHLCISVAIGVTALCLLLFLWYPPPYFEASGGEKLVLLLVGVDLALGPLLTWVVFKSGKKGLKLDLAIIALVQMMALVYGMSVVLRTRPVFVVAAIDRFIIVSADQLEPKDLKAGTQPSFRLRSWTGPRLVAVARPQDRHESSELLWSGLGGKDIELFPKYYVPYAEKAKELLARAQPLDRLRPDDAQSATRVAAWLHAHALKPDQVAWVPLVARRGSDMTMLLDRATGMPLGALAVDPW